MKKAFLNTRGVINPQMLVVLAVIGLVAYFALASTAPFKAGILNTLYPKSPSQAATSLPSCWPNSGSGFAGTLAGQPNAIWCYTDYSDGPSTAVKGTNSWVDDFNHGLTLGKFDTVNYTDFPMIGTGYKSQLFRHGNHWMRDVSGVDQDGPPPYDFMASSMRPNMTFKAENGMLVIEADVATRVAAYGGNLFWPELVITTADHPGEPFKPGAPQYQPEIRTNGTYVYETFPASWTLGCRLQNNGGFTCALLDDGWGGDTPSRVFELSHFQCGNEENSVHPGSVYGCESIYGGLPSNVPANIASYSRDCASLDPDTNCRDRWRWEITNNRMTWFANGVKYMEHTNFKPAARAAIDQLLTKSVYVYFGEFMYKLDKPARMHWDRIAINPKDASGKLLPASTAETFCLGQPFNTCGATTTPPTAPPTNPPASTPPTTPPVTAPPTAPPTPTASSNPNALTVNFDDRPGQNQALTGQYPAGVINWGTGTWWHSGAFGQLTTKNISFNGGSLKSGSLTLISPRPVISIDAFNGGNTTSTVTLACSGQTTRSFSVNANTLQKLSTNWTSNCSSLTITSTNGWDTNFDNLVLGSTNGTVPPTTPTTFRGDYFNNMTLSGNPTLTKSDSTINFNWGANSPANGLPANKFSVRWSGTFTVPTTGNYTFYTTTDDGVRLSVNNSLIINQWTDRSARTTTGTKTLTAGQQVPIVMEYYENQGQASAKLEIQGPNLTRRVMSLNP